MGLVPGRFPPVPGLDASADGQRLEGADDYVTSDWPSNEMATRQGGDLHSRRVQMPFNVQGCPNKFQFGRHNVSVTDCCLKAGHRTLDELALDVVSFGMLRV